jgi:DNA-binding NarL/FixJ family response regulator
VIAMTRLTAREREVLALLRHRRTDAEIAAELFISRRTASNHVSNILTKLGAANRREAWNKAFRLRLV